MKRTLINIAILSSILGTGMSQAGGMDRSGQDTSIIFKDGNVFEVTSISVKPSVSGTNIKADMSGFEASGDVTPDFSMTTIGAKFDGNEQISVAIIQDLPFGAAVSWTAGLLDGTKGNVDSDATTALVSYGVSDAVTVYGGLKSQSLTVSAAIPTKAYTLVGSESTATGYVVGAAFEKPEIALRVALTVHSKITHTMSTLENSVAPSTMDFDTPQSMNLDFQTGIAENTLLFGSMRRVNWTQTAVSPTYFAAGNPTAPNLLDYDKDTTTYKLGLGRKFNATWSGAVTYGFEAAQGGEGGLFSPTDASKKIGLGVTYSGDQLSATVAVQKTNYGDTDVYASGVKVGAMSGNTGLVTAVKIGYKF
jgi:long-subunit fatty acid transport protein